MVHCTGCDWDFTASGYTSHIHHTTRVPCHAIHNSMLTHLGLDDNSDTEPQSFVGDILGDYKVDWSNNEEYNEEVNNNTKDIEEDEKDDDNNGE